MRGCSPRHPLAHQLVQVVPAHAGMFPSVSWGCRWRFSGPRACGDVPGASPLHGILGLWSPRMRGCSQCSTAKTSISAVVPAHAGMFPVQLADWNINSGGPRACGDVPHIVCAGEGELGWSPRMRGCSRGVRRMLRQHRVVPAHAGMFPRNQNERDSRLRGPRACGDVPFAWSKVLSCFQWSPRMRGCSRAGGAQLHARGVVPAHAGMFPPTTSPREGATCGPRACGDVPAWNQIYTALGMWSPRMRGCSRLHRYERQRQLVVPAHAGMFPPRTAMSFCNTSGPRACGDVPSGTPAKKSCTPWSPRMRGCSLRLLPRGQGGEVVPAHAGMFPGGAEGARHARRGPRACGDVPGSRGGRGRKAEWSPRMRGCSPPSTCM